MEADVDFNGFVLKKQTVENQLETVTVLIHRLSLHNNTRTFYTDQSIKTKAQIQKPCVQKRF